LAGSDQNAGSAIRFSISASSRSPAAASKIPPDNLRAGAHGIKFTL